MKLPEQVYICGLPPTWQGEWKQIMRLPMHSEGALSDVIAVKETSDCAEATLLHEMIHAIDDQLGKQLPEEYVETFGVMLWESLYRSGLWRNEAAEDNPIQQIAGDPRRQ